MVSWKNLDTLASFAALKEADKVAVKDVMAGENGAKRVKEYSVPMVDGMVYNYAAKAVDEAVLAKLQALGERTDQEPAQTAETG